MTNPKKPVVTDSRLNRRHFIQYTTLATGALMGSAPALLRGQDLNSRLQVAVIGAGGKGSSDTDSTASAGGTIVGLCDVDRNTLRGRGERYPMAKLYQDYREMLEKMEKEIDAVVVSAPDHVHAPAAIVAMNQGKHCFAQKPLTHSVYEARQMREIARAKGVATQMGNQGSAANGLRRAVEVIQAGVIGKPQELHVWSNRPVWPQGLHRPASVDAVPEHLDWNLWLGPAPFRTFKAGVYHAFNWRGWHDFGTGALGDMACHTVNMPFRALKLGYPSVIECEETSELYPETFPKTSRIRFEFPERDGLPPLKFWWYDGNPGDNSIQALRPHSDLTSEIVSLRGSLPTSGCLIVGDRGKIFSPDDYGSQFFILTDGEKAFSPGADHEACQAVPQSIPRSPGHYKEWIDAIQGGAPAYSHFDVAAYLTEIILLGCVAMRVGVGQRLDWDGPAMKARNTSVADQFVRREYRSGWDW
jgi:predicted dehydrogenase